MSTVAALHSGQVVPADWSGDTLDVTISVGDISDCILYLGGGKYANNDDTDDGQTLGYLVNSTTLRFKNGASEGTIDWRILEFDSGQITSQHGETAFDSTSVTVTLSTVTDITDAWCMLMGMYDDSGGGSDGGSIGRLEFTDATSLTFISSGSVSDNFAWQVIKYDTAADIACQHGSITLASVSNDNASLSPSVTLAQSLVFINGVTWTGPDNADDSTFYGDFESTSLVRATRVSSVGTAVVAYSVADMSDGAAVQTGHMADLTDFTDTATLSPAVTLARSHAFATSAVHTASEGAGDTTLERPGRQQVRLTFNSTTEILATRPTSSGSIAFQWQVCEWPAAGGTTYFQTNTGALTPSGNIVKSTLKALAGALTLAGAITKLVTKNPSGSLTPTGATTKETQKSFAGSLMPTGALSSFILFTRSLAGSLTPVGSVVRKTFKSVAGALTSSGSITKRTSKSAAGSLSPVGSVVKETQKSFSGSLTPSGVVTRALVFLRTIVGALTPSGDITKQTQKSFSGDVAPSADITKRTNKAVDGSLTPDGDIVKDTSKDLAGDVTPTGSLTPSTLFKTTVAGVVGIAGALATLLIEGGGGTLTRGARRLLNMVRVLGRGQKRR